MRAPGVFVLLALFMTACSSAVTPTPAVTPPVTEPLSGSELSNAETGTEAAPETIPIPLSLYILTEAHAPTSTLSSRRSTDEVEVIASAVQAIWQPAGIAFDPINVAIVAVPAEVLEAIVRSGDSGLFFDQVGRTFDAPDPGLINGFYVVSAAGVNGFNPVGSTVFFVVDEPSVHDERVSSHEIGHILGLRHASDDVGRLMFSGTNGMTLTVQEEEVARYGAEGLVEGRR